MSLVAVVGEGSTTTALGLVAAWNADESCLLVELDPFGGCLAAWLDLPRSPGLGDVVASATPGSWRTIEAAVQHATSGIDVLLAPTSAIEAGAVVNASSRSVLPVLAAVESTVVIADGGRLRAALSALATTCDAAVVVHRQRAGSAAAAALGIERIADVLAGMTARSIPTVVALIGERPYSAAEVAQFLDAEEVVAIADDPWAAAVLAGRAGSAVRLRRSLLMRSLTELAGVVSALLRHRAGVDPTESVLAERRVDDRS